MAQAIPNPELLPPAFATSPRMQGRQSAGAAPDRELELEQVSEPPSPGELPAATVASVIPLVVPLRHRAQDDVLDVMFPA
jgi:hypothetical protein